MVVGWRGGGDIHPLLEVLFWRMDTETFLVPVRRFPNISFPPLSFHISSRNQFLSARLNPPIAGGPRVGGGGWGVGGARRGWVGGGGGGGG